LLLNYEDTTRRRLYSSSLFESKSLRRSLSIRDSCHFDDNGQRALVGQHQEIQCEHYGTIVQICQSDMTWQTIDTDDCSYLPPISESVAVCFGVGAFIASYFAFTIHTSNKKE
jgi:hypothetical protein